jgi:hypothetical protein
MARAGFVYTGLGAKGVEVYVRRCGCRVFRWRVRLDGATAESLEARTCGGQILRPKIPDPRWPHEAGEWIRDWAAAHRLMGI